MVSEWDSNIFVSEVNIFSWFRPIIPCDTDAITRFLFLQETTWLGQYHAVGFPGDIRPEDV